MTTYNCEICSEEKELGQMTFCGNGHFGGCQKCHMEFIKTSYKTTLNVFRGQQHQRCMFCREDLYDIQMGEDWAVKLYSLQPIMMYNYLKQQGGKGELTLKELISRYNLTLRKPKSFSYEWIKDIMAEYKGISVKLICLFMTQLDKDMSNDQIKSLFSRMSYCEDEEIEVVKIYVDGVLHYQDDKNIVYNQDFEMVGKDNDDGTCTKFSQWYLDQHNDVITN